MSHGPSCDVTQLAGLDVDDTVAISRMVGTQKFSRIPVSQWQDGTRWTKFSPSQPVFIHHKSYGNALAYGVRVRSGFSIHANGVVTIYACRKVFTGKEKQVSPLYAVPSVVRVGGQTIDMVLPLRYMIVHIIYNREEPGVSKLQIASSEDGHHGGRGLVMTLRDFLNRVQEDDGTQGWKMAKSAFISSNPNAEPYFDRIWSSEDPRDEYDQAGLDLNTESRLTPGAPSRVQHGPSSFSRVGAPLLEFSAEMKKEEKTEMVGAGYQSSSSDVRAARAHHVVSLMYGDVSQWYTKLCDLPGVIDHSSVERVSASTPGESIGAHYSVAAAYASLSSAMQPQ